MSDDLVSRLRDPSSRDAMQSKMDLRLEVASALEAKDAEIASAQKCCDSYADENQRLSDRITFLERQLAEETERCARVAIDEKVGSCTGDGTDEAYNRACDHIAAAIRGGAK